MGWGDSLGKEWEPGLKEAGSLLLLAVCVPLMSLSAPGPGEAPVMLQAPLALRGTSSEVLVQGQPISLPMWQELEKKSLGQGFKGLFKSTPPKKQGANFAFY